MEIKTYWIVVHDGEDDSSSLTYTISRNDAECIVKLDKLMGFSTLGIHTVEVEGVVLTSEITTFMTYLQQHFDLTDSYGRKEYLKVHKKLVKLVTQYQNDK